MVGGAPCKGPGRIDTVLQPAMPTKSHQVLNREESNACLSACVQGVVLFWGSTSLHGLVGMCVGILGFHNDYRIFLLICNIRYQ